MTPTGIARRTFSRSGTTTRFLNEPVAAPLSGRRSGRATSRSRRIFASSALLSPSGYMASDRTNRLPAGLSRCSTCRKVTGTHNSGHGDYHVSCLCEGVPCQSCRNNQMNRPNTTIWCDISGPGTFRSYTRVTSAAESA